jgi:hypothetical protein
MFEDDAFDNASVHSSSPDEEQLGNYMHVVEYVSFVALLTCHPAATDVMGLNLLELMITCNISRLHISQALGAAPCAPASL